MAIERCKCGSKRPLQPWNQHFIINVDACAVCKPKRLNEQPWRAVVPPKMDLLPVTPQQSIRFNLELKKTGS